MSNELGEPNVTLEAIEKSIEQIWRDEALLLAVDANVGYTGLEVFVKGYIAGRDKSKREAFFRNVANELDKKLNFEVDELVPYNELWLKNSDGTVSKTIIIGNT